MLIQLLALATVVAESTAAHPDIGGRQPFTVADSIAFTQFVDPPIALAQFQDIGLNRSPNGKEFVVVIRNGNLTTGDNEYSLRLYRKPDIRHALAMLEGEAPFRTLVRMSTDSPDAAIERVQWSPDGREIAFIGRNHGIGQVYMLDLNSERLRRLTKHPSDIVTFNMVWKRDLLLFSAKHARDWSDRKRRGYVVRSQFASDLGTNDPTEVAQDLAHYVLNLDTGESHTLPMPLADSPQEFHVSPSGHWAVVLGQVHSIPPRWYEYDLLRSYVSARLPGSGQERAREASFDSVSEEAFGGTPDWIYQYYVINLRSGTAGALIDAPAVETAGASKVLWSQDEQRVIVTDTYMPLDGGVAHEDFRRTSIRAVVEVDLETRDARRVADQPERGEDGSTRILLGARLLARDLLEIRERPYLGASDIVRRYRKVHGNWIPASQKLAEPEPLAEIQVSVAQGMNSPPDLRATDRRTGHSRLITDLNPSLRERTIGTMEPFNWTDKWKRSFRGGLLLPPNYDPRRRYPVVIQTYGFSPEEFLVDGPNGVATAYCARALSSLGFIVLQMPELDAPISLAAQDSPQIGENDRFLQGLESAITAMDERGIADLGRIGIIGWSREGMHVHYAVTFSDFKFSAAVISDSITATPLSYVLVYGAARPGMMEWEKGGLVGAPLWGDGVKLWLQHSPLFHLHRIKTPLRLETIGLGVPSLWETFAILRRQRRPVELIHIPGDVHALQTPWARYTSQQGAVDWFSFWLLGREDDHASKLEQYQRWRELRDQQEALHSDLRMQEKADSSFAPKLRD